MTKNNKGQGETWKERNIQQWEEENRSLTTITINRNFSEKYIIYEYFKIINTEQKAFVTLSYRKCNWF